MNQTDRLLSAKQLHTYYGSSHILFGIDFDISAHESVALLGRNGMGKTTLIKTLLNVVTPRQGDCFFKGRSLTGLKTHEIIRQGIAYVPEGRGIFPSLTVKENLLLAQATHQDTPTTWHLDEILSFFPRLKERFNHFGDHLSGGEQQMLSIGRALLLNPSLLILDEATEGLAPIVAQSIWQTIHSVKAKGVATIIVDKNYTATTAVADRVYVLSKGQVVFEGTPAQLNQKTELIQKHLGI